jgi:hypothetical protein
MEILEKKDPETIQKKAIWKRHRQRQRDRDRETERARENVESMCEGRGRRLMGKNEREWKREREGDRMRGGSNVGLIEMQQLVCSTDSSRNCFISFPPEILNPLECLAMNSSSSAFLVGTDIVHKQSVNDKIITCPFHEDHLLTLYRRIAVLFHPCRDPCVPCTSGLLSPIDCLLESEHIALQNLVELPFNQYQSCACT